MDPSTPVGSSHELQLVASSTNDGRDAHLQNPHEISKAEHDYPGNFRLFLILLALFMTTFLAALDLGIVSTAIPSISSEFNSLNEIGWYGGSYFLTIGCFSSFWGKIYRYLDAKYVFLATTFIFLIGSVVAATATNSTALIVGRAVAGVGGAGIVGGSYVITHQVARPERRPALTGLIGAVFIFSSILGPIIGGVFTYEVSWRWCFYINLPVGGAAMLLVLFFVRLPKHAAPEHASLREMILQLDFPGMAVMIPALVCFALAMQWGGIEKAWSNGSVVACLVVWIVLTGAFVAVQIYQGDHAMIPPRIFANRVVWSNCLYVFFINGPNFLVIYYLPVYFQSIKGVNAIQSGVDILPAVCFFALGCLSAGWTIGRIHYWQPFLTAGALLSVVGSALIYSLEVDTAQAWYLGSQVVFGFGAGGSSQVPMIAIQAFSQPRDLSSATGLVLFFQLVNGLYFISIGQAIFANRLLQVLPRLAPGVDTELVLGTGAGDIHKVFSGPSLSGVLDSYMVGLKAAFALGLAAAAMCVLVSFLAPMKKLPKKMDGNKEAVMIG